MELYPVACVRRAGARKRRAVVIRVLNRIGGVPLNTAMLAAILSLWNDDPPRVIYVAS